MWLGFISSVVQLLEHNSQYKSIFSFILDYVLNKTVVFYIIR